jgi:N-acetylmuramoyl-L-alanine amidase
MRAVRAVARILAIAAMAAAFAPPLRAGDDLTALARLDPAASGVTDTAGGSIALDLALSQPVPYRVFLLADPLRLVMDFSELDFGPSRAGALDRSNAVTRLGWGLIRPGWSRLVAELGSPYRIRLAGVQTSASGEAVLNVTLDPTSAEDFAVLAANAPADTGRWAFPAAAAVTEAKRRQTGETPLVVVLDPGHGGIDPGAEAGGMVEAEIMLTFARELAETLRRAGMVAVLTRKSDEFVPLETRISLARDAGADVFLSLHADSLPEGEATGATIYRMDETASDSASARLAERHDRADLLAGVDLAGQDDILAGVMMDLARTETRPRGDRLANEIAAALGAAGIKTHRHPIQQAAFSVLKSPDIPSLLIETGFLSSQKDRQRLNDPVWRAALQTAIVSALETWAIADAAEARLLRR